VSHSRDSLHNAKRTLKTGHELLLSLNSVAVHGSLLTVAKTRGVGAGFFESKKSILE
jgi:hypothetical protein